MKEYTQKAPELFSPVRSENNHTELYIDGPENLSMLLREIKNARHYIHFQVMLFYSDEAGFRIARALAEKAREGVEVRVMSDSDMSNIVRAIEKYRSSGTSDFSDLKGFFMEAGVKFVASDKESYRLGNWEEVRLHLKESGVPEEFLVMQDAIQEGILLNANVFDHRKVFVFDGKTAVVTGINIGNKYLYEEKPAEEKDDKYQKGELWHDGSLLIKGPCVSVLNKLFASKWMVRGGDIFDYHKHYRTKDSYGTDVCTTFSTFPGLKENYSRNYYLQKIKDCKGEFIIENPYVNDDLFWDGLSALDKEQARKIILINPYKARGNDYIQNASAIKCKMWKPFQRGVNFYSYEHRMTHWKIALDVQQEEVFLGSYNLNHRSAMHDFELNILVESKQMAAKVKQMLEEDMAASTKITDAGEFYEHPERHPECLLLKATEYFE